MHFKGRSRPQNFDPQILDGILGLHVDDFVGGGEGAEAVATKGFGHQRFAAGTFTADLALLAQACEFGCWDFSGEQFYCGTRVKQDSHDMSISLDQEQYIHKSGGSDIRGGLRQC